MWRASFSRWLALAVLAAGWVAHAAAPASAPDRWRRLARLPRVDIQVGLAYQPGRGFSLLAQTANPEREVAELRRAMQGRPTDAPRYLGIGRLHTRAGDVTNAVQAWRQAVRLYRQSEVADSENGALLTDFGEALHGAGQMEDAERTLRRAIQIAPHAWRGQALLGRLLADRALGALFGQIAPAASGEALIEALKRSPPTPGAVETCRRLTREAREASDRAVTAGPDQAEAYAIRALVCSTDHLMSALLRSLEGADSDPLEVHLASFTLDALPDLQRAAELSPNDTVALGTAAFYELFAAGLAQRGTRMEQLLPGAAWASLPETHRRSLRAALARLEELGQGADPRSAASALEIRGALQALALNDLRGAETSLRRATALEPTRELAWEVLFVCLIAADRWDELLPLAELRVKGQDTVRNRLLLAKACERLRQPERALEQVEHAVRREPDGLLPNLSLAGLALQGTDPALLARVPQALAKVQQALSRPAPPSQVFDFLFLTGLHLALTDRPDLARATFERLLELDPGHTEAKEALSALE